MTEDTEGAAARDNLAAPPLAADLIQGDPRPSWSDRLVRLQSRTKGSTLGLALYVIARLLLLIPGGLLVATATFFLVNAVPSDPIGARLGDFATPEQIDELKAQFGLDKGLWDRYTAFISNILHGDFGTSYKTGESVISGMQRVVTSSLVIVVPGFIVGALLGIALGGWQARSRRPGGIRLFITAVQAMPTFVLSVFGILLIVATLNWLPAPSGQYPVSTAPPPNKTGAASVDFALAGRWDDAFKSLEYLILPVSVLGLALMVPFARITASTIRNNLDADFTMFARANGIKKRYVTRNARRAARTSIITTSGIVAAELMGGTVIIERVFSWNGLGSYALSAIIDKDLPAIQGFVLLTTLATMITFVVSDILGTLLDPRLR